MTDEVKKVLDSTIARGMQSQRDANALGEFAVAKLMWVDRKGAGQMRQGNAALLAKRLEKLRCEAKLKLLDGTVIGECTRNPENPRRWIWWYDHSALRVEQEVQL